MKNKFFEKIFSIQIYNENELTRKKINLFGIKLTLKEKMIFDSVQNIIDLVLNNDNKPILYFDHLLGGGTEQYSAFVLNSKFKNNCVVVLQYMEKIHCYKLSIHNKGQIYKFNIKKFEDIIELLKQIKFKQIIINNLVGNKSTFKILDSIKNFKNDAKVSMMLHDFFCICPNYVLLNNDDDFCELPNDYKECENCYALKGFNEDDMEYINSKGQSSFVEIWRQLWHEFLYETVDEIICFSESSKEILLKIYPDIMNKTELQPHKVIPFPDKKSIIVGILGSITNKHKGCRVVKQLDEYLRNNNIKNVTIKIIGEYIETIDEQSNIKVLGKYQRNDIPEIIKQNGIDLIFIPSICVETFSYTTQEAIMTGLPVLVFNLGGQADQVKNYSNGKIIPDKSPEKIYQSILEVSSVLTKN